MSTITRVTNLAQHQQLLKDASDAQVRLATLQKQISSGNRADNYSEIGTGVSLLGALQKKIRAADQYLQSNQLIKSRLQTMGKAVSTIIDITNDLKSIITTARSSSISEGALLAQQVDGLKKALSEQLNANVGGRFLFAGSKTDSPPVDYDLPENVVMGTPDSSYYHGDDVVLSSNISDQFDMNYGVTANDPAFQKLVAVLNLASFAIGSQSQAQLGQAFDMANEALDDINAINSSINNNTVTIDNNAEVLSSLKGYWQGMADNQTKTDLIEASTKVQLDQAILQASFQVFARISSLRLIDFLK